MSYMVALVINSPLPGTLHSYVKELRFASQNR